jgi:16S rRNA (cytidine1402-2'-O)-methyltransferase
LGTLFVSSLPAGGLDDLPLRAQRTLREVSLVISSNPPRARQALRDLPLAVPLVGSTGVDALLACLETGNALLLLDGVLAGPTAPAHALIRAAAEHGFPVVSVPGPTLPVTALVVSGLPADSFLYLGLLPEEPVSRQELLASVAHEKRTLIVVTQGTRPEPWASLFSALGARQIAVFSDPDLAGGANWQGTLGQPHQPETVPDPDGLHVLVIGGSPDLPAPWTEDRLRAEIRARLDQGQDVRHTARQLATESGWPRRAIYRMAAQAASPSPESHVETIPLTPNVSQQEERNHHDRA